MKDGAAPRPGPAYRHDALDRQQVREVAAHGCVDEKTVIKYLRIRDGERGLNMTSTARARVENALKACGFDRLVMKNGAG